MSADSIITSRLRQAAAGDIDSLRLHDPVDINIIERRGGITISSFKATNYTTQAEEPFIAYIFRDEEAEGDYKVFALQNGGNPTTASIGSGSSSAGTSVIQGNNTTTGSSSAGTP